VREQKLFNIIGLSDYTGIPVRTLRTLMAARKIPYLKLGHRTVMFDSEKVNKALNRFQVTAVGEGQQRAAAQSRLK
jgi:hypothetical protein